MKPYNPTLWENRTLTLQELSLWEKILLGSSLAGILTLSFPHVSIASTVSEPFIFELNTYEDLPLISFQTQEDLFASVLAKSVVVEPKDPRLEPMQQYLESKKSPLTSYAEAVLQQYHFRLILGISFAESNFCKRQIRPYNCWGIGGGYPETYSSYPEALERANELIQKYHALGMTTPKLMRNSWVGWHNDNWIIAVEQVSDELEQQGL